ncbi:unnamed protein product, partial [Brassica oleracea]
RSSDGDAIERRRRDRATATRSSDGDAIERRRRDRATATRSSDDDGDAIERRLRDRATATRSSDGDAIECILSHEADEIQTRNLKMSNPQQESQVIIFDHFTGLRRL